MNFRNSSAGFSKLRLSSSLATCSVVIDQRALGVRVLGYGFCGKSSPLPTIARGFASSSFQNVGRGDRSGVRSSRDLPWRGRGGVFHKSNDRRRRPERATAAGPNTGSSSWEESARIFFQKKGQSTSVGMAHNGQTGGDEIVVEDDIDNAEVSIDKGSRVLANGETLPWLASGHKSKTEERDEKATSLKPSISSWEKSATDFLQRSSTVSSDGRVSRSGSVDMVKNRRNDNGSNSGDGNENIVENEEGKEEDEVVDDPRWNNIKNRFRNVLNAKPGSEKPEFRQWNRQENWGRKTWKEATESTIPRMVGEAIYGVGPVLAALSAEKREFYCLYVQEGLDLSRKNKKKDKKRFEKVLMMAEKIGLTKKDVSKHDLNMVSDNRPHQGLVLDASPLEMVGIKELGSFTVEGVDCKSPIWLALDEVMDPQNLGAIIRSAYFFGATGVVLCAKNSAPLSGVVSKASAGSLELIEVRCCKNMMRFLSSSAENGWRVIGGSISSKSIPVNDVTPGAPTILVLGSEGIGLRPLVERSCTELIRIPGSIPVDIAAGTSDGLEPANIDRRSYAGDFRPFTAVDSLNVSVAAGVLLYHLTQKPQKPSSGISSSIDSPATVLE